jgi:hypothetical protein
MSYIISGNNRKYSFGCEGLAGRDQGREVEERQVLQVQPRAQGGNRSLCHGKGKI